MKFISIVVIFFCCLLFNSCQKRAHHAVLLDRKLSSFAKEVKRTDDLELFGFGGGAIGQINCFSLAFTSDQICTIDEARYQFVNIAYRFLQSVNSDPEISQYLAVYPCTMKQFDLMILYEPKIGRYKDKYVAGVVWKSMHGRSSKSEILFSIDDPLTGESEYYFEMCEEAFNKVKL